MERERRTLYGTDVVIGSGTRLRMSFEVEWWVKTQDALPMALVRKR